MPNTIIEPHINPYQLLSPVPIYNIKDQNIVHQELVSMRELSNNKTKCYNKEVKESPV